MMLNPSNKLIAIFLIAAAVLFCACSDDEGNGNKVVVIVTDAGMDSGGSDAGDNGEDTTTTTDAVTGTNTSTDANPDTDTAECIPKTCEDYNATCGQALDDCGGTLNCGSCGFDEDCIDNACVDIGCRPTSCEIEGAFCGEVPDGCQGDPLNCGECDGGFLCGTLRQCIPGPDPVCGNSTTEFPEQCDNGSSNSNFQPDACRRDCTLPRCGDNVPDSDEDCDDGSNTIESDACRADCTSPPHCAPCSSDAACGPGGRCLSQLGDACVMACSTTDGAAACPSGYACQTVGGVGSVCMPTQGFCAEICNNGLDDDGDNDADCADSDCLSQPYCDPTEGSCIDNFDNDGDGRKDCLDSDCDGNAACVCADVVCDSPPGGTCASSDTLNGSQLPGTCSPSTGQCTYTSGTITCNPPPPTSCAAGNDAINTYADTAADCRTTSGVGQCAYNATTTDCDSPPAPTCNSGNTGITTHINGSADCVASGSTAQCAYQSTTTLCATPPLATCVGDVATVFAANGTCALNSGTPTCVYTSSIVNCATQGKVCGATGCEPNVPVVASVDYPVIAHGGKLIITGSRFTGATSVTLGGVSQTFTVNSATQITIDAITDSVAVGNQPLVISSASADGLPFTVKVIHLVINELDSDQPKEGPDEDKYEFIEITTGLNEAVNLTGYVLIPIGGDEKTYTLGSFNGVLGTTPADGLLLLGTTNLSVTPDIIFSRNTLENGADAVAIYQRASAPASGTSISTSSLPENIIDAVVYDTDDNDDTGLLDRLFGPSGTPGRSQVDEGPTNNTNSIRRCASTRRNGSSFNQDSSPSPGSTNGCP